MKKVKIRIKVNHEIGLYQVQERRRFLFFHYWGEIDYFFWIKSAQEYAQALEETGFYEFTGYCFR